MQAAEQREGRGASCDPQCAKDHGGEHICKVVGPERDAAESNGVSVSKWIAQRIQKDARTEWPTSVRELAGAWQDLPSAEQIRRHAAKDVKRGRL